jgi:hypothetical protein
VAYLNRIVPYLAGEHKSNTHYNLLIQNCQSPVLTVWRKVNAKRKLLPRIVMTTGIIDRSPKQAILGRV